MHILGIDPGTTSSAWVLWCQGTSRVREAVTTDNANVLQRISLGGFDLLAIEMIESQGMAVGRSTFETVLWIGSFVRVSPKPFQLVHRSCIKLHHCGSARAKDGNIRQALIDTYGAPGTKKAPGPTYGVSSHQWQALAVATLVSEGGAVKLPRNALNVPEVKELAA